jgi:selT/selW/selH-like putative selenoprotein
VLREAGHEASTLPGGTGQFDVLADDRVVFSKGAEGRFPEEDEIVKLLSPS